MSGLTWEQVDQLLGTGTLANLNDNSNCLGRPNISCTIEVTLNYPNTAKYKRLTAEQTRYLYEQLFDYMFAKYVKSEKHIEYEFCKSGKMHLHGRITLHFDNIYYVNGLIIDIVKRYLSQLPKRYSDYRESFMHYGWNRYKCASICLQYTQIDDVERQKLWNAYIEKTRVQN